MHLSLPARMSVFPESPSAQRAGSRARSQEKLALLFVMVLAVILRCWGVWREAYEVDELQSLAFLSAPTYEQFLKGMWQFGSPPMPAYFRLEYFLYHHVYPAAMTIRLFSIVAGVLTIPVVYLLGRRFGGSQVALLAATCIALSPFCVWYSQEARMYALLPLYGVLSVHAMLLALEPGRSRLWWLGHLAANALLTWTHFFSALVCVVEGLYLMCFFWRRYRLLFLWGLFHVLMLIGLIAWMMTLDLQHISSFAKAAGAYSAPFFLVFVSSVFAMTGGLAGRYDPHFEVSVPATPDLVLALAVYGLAAYFFVRSFRQWRERHSEPFRLAVLLLLWLTVPLILLSVFCISHPCLWNRYLLPSMPCLAITAGMGVMAIKTSGWRHVFAMTLIGLYGLQAFLFLDVPRRADTPVADQYLKENRKPGEIVIAYDIWDSACALLFPNIPDEDVVTPTAGELAEKALPLIEDNQRVWMIVIEWPHPSEKLSRFMAARFQFWRDGTIYENEVLDFVASRNPPPSFKEFPSWCPIRVYLFDKGVMRQ